MNTKITYVIKKTETERNNQNSINILEIVTYVLKYKGSCIDNESNCSRAIPGVATEHIRVMFRAGTLIHVLYNYDRTYAVIETN